MKKYTIKEKYTIIETDLFKKIRTETHFNSYLGAWLYTKILGTGVCEIQNNKTGELNSIK